MVWPWVLGEQKIFTRINDLKQHVPSSHQSVFNSLSTSFFTVATGFYLAIHPDDYRRIVNIGRYEQEECCEARKAALRWCTSQLNATRVTEERRSAWQRAKATDRKTGNDEKSTSKKEKVPEQGRGTCIEKQEEDKDLDKDPVVYLDYVVPAKKSKDRPLQYTSLKDSTTSESSTEGEQTDAPMAKEFVAIDYGGLITNSGDAAITDGIAADTREVTFNDRCEGNSSV